jgi:hypothetical protein
VNKSELTNKMFQEIVKEIREVLKSGGTLNRIAQLVAQKDSKAEEEDHILPDNN